MSSRVAGLPCNCVSFLCFKVTTEDERRAVLERLNELGSKNEQGSMLSVLIRVKTIQHRQQENEAHPHDYTYSYVVNIVRETRAAPELVCLNPFLSIFGGTKARVERIRATMAKKKRKGIKTRVGFEQSFIS